MSPLAWGLAALLVIALAALWASRRAMKRDVRREVRVQHREVHRETTDALAQARGEVEALKTMVDGLRAEIDDLDDDG